MFINFSLITHKISCHDSQSSTKNDSFGTAAIFPLCELPGRGREMKQVLCGFRNFGIA
jgi:hypothetical protein